MNHLNLRSNLLFVFILMLFSGKSFSQNGEGQVTINQDEKIATLLNLKKEINKDTNTSETYKIQVYNGNRKGAISAQEEYLTSYTWSSRIVFETPNFKLWAGNFRTRLEADRALTRIKKKFPNAFIFKPKKKDKK